MSTEERTNNQALSHPAAAVSNGAVTLIHALRKGWHLIVSFGLLGFGVSFFYSKSLPKVYEASAVVQLEPTVVHPLGNKDDTIGPAGDGFYWDNQEYYETQYRIVTSQRVMSRVAQELNLGSDAEFMGYKGALAKPASLEDAAGALVGRVRVEPVKNSRLFTIFVDDTNPHRAALLCQKIADTYVDENLQTAVDATSDAAVWLSGQLDIVQKGLTGNELALDQFKRDNNLPSMDINEASNMLRQEMIEYDTALTRTRTRKEEIAARYQELSKIASDPNRVDDVPASELLSNEFLQQLRAAFQAAAKERNDLLAEGKGEAHPLVKMATERIEEARTSLLHEINNIKGALEKDLAIVTREEAGEADLYEKARKSAVDLNIKEIEYHRLDRERDQKEKLFERLTDREKEAEMGRNMHANNIHVLDRPLEPRAPVRPRISLNVSIGLALGVFLGLALAWLREVLDSSIKTPEDVEQDLGLTMLGLLPEIDDGEGSSRKHSRRRHRATTKPGHAELIVHERPSSGIAEAARSVRTNLMFMSPDKPFRTMLVSSAAPSEGKTTVACNLAIALAQGGQRVCIVDCDLRRPRLHRIFDRPGEFGVTNVLVGDATIGEVALPTHVPNLYCIPSGPVPPNPADLLHSERFKKFVQDLSENFDRVIFDSPPLVAVTDSAIISTRVDGTVFVVRAFKTTRALSRHGLRTLWDVDAPVIGALLNAVNFNKHEYNYYQYYYRREGYAPVEAVAG